MKKDIKDYLHYYLGCDVQVTSITTLHKWPIRQLVGVINDPEGGEYIFITVQNAGTRSSEYLKIFDVKPILRPLSDMTEDEAKTLLKIRYWRPGQEPIYQRHSSLCIDFKFYYTEDKYSETQLDWDMLDANSFHYLLSKHFDLFGLVDAGIALDKTKVP